MRLVISTEGLSKGKKYVCGQLHPDDSSWEVWDVMDWDDEEKVFYCPGNLFDEGKPLEYFKYVYELPNLK